MTYRTHVFLVNSNLVGRVCEEIVKIKKINEIDCIFIMYRGSVISLKSNRHKIIVGENANVNIILDQTKKFILYAPHFEKNEFKNIVLMKSCCGFYFVEEGILSYNKINNKFGCSNNKKKFIKYYIKTILNPNRKIKEFIKINNKYLGCFAINNEAFKDYKNKKLINIFDYKKSSFDAIILVPLVAKALKNMNMLSEFSMILKKGIISHDKIGIKFHPSQIEFDDEMNLLKDIINEYENTQILENELLIEDYIGDENLSIYSAYISSVILYAATNGRAKIYVNSSVLKYLQVSKLIPAEIIREKILNCLE